MRSHSHPAKTHRLCHPLAPDQVQGLEITQEEKRLEASVSHKVTAAERQALKLSEACQPCDAVVSNKRAPAHKEAK